MEMFNLTKARDSDQIYNDFAVKPEKREKYKKRLEDQATKVKPIFPMKPTTVLTDLHTFHGRPVTAE